jgi:AraC-like DNA-binding protein
MVNRLDLVEEALHPEFRGQRSQSRVTHFAPGTEFNRAAYFLAGGCQGSIGDAEEQTLLAAASQPIVPRGEGKTPFPLLGITELVHAKMEDELTLIEMARSVELSPAHFSRMFRKSTGEPPHQFVLRNRIGRAKEMLREPGPAQPGLSLVAGHCGPRELGLNIQVLT